LLLVPAILSADDAKEAPSQDSALFDRLDTDKDGQLTAAEIPADKRRLFQRLLRVADQDKSGGLSRAEFLAGVADHSPELPLEEKPTLDPANPSGLPSPEQFLQRFDKNMDGKVTLDEVPDEGRDRFQQLLARADKNNDNAVSKEEMTELVDTTNKQLKAGAGQDARDPRQMFKYLDTNGDGKVALDEVPGERREGFEKMLKAFDKDGDGKLNEEEFVAGMRAVQARQGDKSESSPPKSSDAKPGESKPADSSDSKDGKSASRRKQLAKRLGKGSDADKLTQRILQLDKNKDGKISREEAAGPVAEHFDTFDANKDGFVDEAEIHERLAQVKSNIDAAKAAGQRRAKPGN
jgi:Ca2+-binding EF-hand superfamily protein